MIQQTGRIQPWVMDDTDRKTGLEMQVERKAAGITEGQLAFLLDTQRCNYLSYERGEVRCPPNVRAQIREILGKVKAGLLAIPNLNKEV